MIEDWMKDNDFYFERRGLLELYGKHKTGWLVRRVIDSPNTIEGTIGASILLDRLEYEFKRDCEIYLKHVLKIQIRQ